MGEDGTPPPHRDFKEECGAAVAHPRASTTSYDLSLFAVSHQFSQRPSCHLSFFPLMSSFSLLLFHSSSGSSLSSAASF